MYGGRCGICGDPWGDYPRAHEAPGGIYATGIIVKTYKQGSYIPIIIDITANHQGYMEFKMCANNDIFLDPDQRCFDSSPALKVGNPEEEPSLKDWGRAFPIHDYATGLRLMYVQLPLEIESCDQCILQWTYHAGNNWGKCADGTGAMGCGPQETFRGCADISIVPHPMLSMAKRPSVDDNALKKVDEEIDTKLEEFFSLANDEHSSAEDYDYVETADYDVDEAALVAKKRMLDRIMDRLKQLILESQQIQENQQEQQLRHNDAISASQISTPRASFGSADLREVRGNQISPLHNLRSQLRGSHYENDVYHPHTQQVKLSERRWDLIKSNAHG